MPKWIFHHAKFMPQLQNVQILIICKHFSWVHRTFNFGMEFSDWTNTEKRFPNQSEMFFLPTRDASVAFGKWLSSSSKANSPIGFIKNMSSKGWLSIKDTWIPSNPSLLYSACKCTEIVTTTFSQLTFKSSTGQELNFWILLACRDGFYRPDSNSTSLGRSVCG